MQFVKSTLAFGEVSPPENHWCTSGHQAVSEYIRDPAKGPEPTKFFEVSGESLDRSRWGVYCEPCIIQARRLGERKKRSASIMQNIAEEIWNKEDH